LLCKRHGQRRSHVDPFLSDECCVMSDECGVVRD
jgi:hypothetical protein